MTLALRGGVRLPEHPSGGGFDHGDVHIPTGHVFVAYTANDTVEVIVGQLLSHERTVPDCPDASGVLCAYGSTDLLFAAARGNGTVLVIDPLSYELLRLISVGPPPNGLAWDPVRGHLLVADVQTFDARLMDPPHRHMPDSP